MSRALALLGLAWLALIALSSLQAVAPLSWGCRFAVPDVLLLLVLFVGLSGRGELGAACAFGVAAGYLGDLFHGAPKGTHMLAYAGAVMAARVASTRLLVRGPIATAAVALAFALTFGVVVTALRVAVDGAVGWGPLGQVPVAALVTALFAPTTFRLLRRLDRRFARDPRVLGVAFSTGALR